MLRFPPAPGAAMLRLMRQGASSSSTTVLTHAEHQVVQQGCKGNSPILPNRVTLLSMVAARARSHERILAWRPAAPTPRMSRLTPCVYVTAGKSRLFPHFNPRESAVRAMCAVGRRDTHMAFNILLSYTILSVVSSRCIACAAFTGQRTDAQNIGNFPCDGCSVQQARGPNLLLQNIRARHPRQVA